MTALRGTSHLWTWYTPASLGGVETFLQRITREACGRGITSIVAAVQTWEGPFRSQYDERVELADWTAFYPAFMGKEPAGPFEKLAAKDLSRWSPGVIWLNDAVDFGLGTVPLLRRLRHYCAIIDVMHADSPEEGYIRRRKPYVKLLDGVVSSSRRALDRYRDEVSPPAGMPLAYVPYGVPVNSAQHSDCGDILRLLWSGRLDQPQKRVLDLVPLLRELRAAGLPFRLTIAGDGPERGALMEQLRGEGLDTLVKLEGSVPPDRMASLYAAHDVLVSLSAYEGFSISVIEAMAGGCVPLCTDLPGLDRTVLKAGTNCIVIPVGDPGAAARALVDLSAVQIRAMSSAASASARTMSVDRCLDDYLAVLDAARLWRPLLPWPEDLSGALGESWDMSRFNPWIPRPHPVRRFLRGLSGRA